MGAHDSELAARVGELVKKLPISTLVLHALSSMLEAVSNLALVLLFAVYLLLSPPSRNVLSPSPTSSAPDVNAQADQQIHSYIRGKVLMSLLVGIFTAMSLSALQVDLWLVFGLLAFWLNFIPNVGTVLAVALPMPIVIIDPSFSAMGVALALLLPLGAHAFAGNVLEPLMFGHTLKLHPVTVLLSLMVWGSTWGVTGMVVACPMTAVLRIRLSHVHHPLPQYIASLLVGDKVAPSSPRRYPSSPRAPMDVAPLAEALMEEGEPPAAAPRDKKKRPKRDDEEVANAPLIGNDGAAAVAQEMPSLSQNISSSSREMPSSSREMQMCQMGARETLPTDEMRTSAAAADAPSCYRRGGA